MVEVVVSTLSPAQTKVATLLPGCTTDVFSQVISPLSPPSLHKRGRLFTDDTYRCRRCVLPGMVAFGTMESGLLDEEEGPIRVLQSSRPSDAPVLPMSKNLSPC